MDLSRRLVKQFSDAVNASKNKTEKSSTVTGTVTKIDGKTYVKLDGSESETPVSTTSDVVVGERVMVRIQNHQAFILGNFSSPSARTDTVQDMSKDVDFFKAKGITTENFETESAKIGVLTVKAANAKYATIDFGNITEVSIKNLFSKYGLIENLVLKDGNITGELVGVTIKGDLIEGNTVKADKLVVKGSDGIYYKLNIEGGEFKDGEEVPTDGLHGSVIVAKSITAEKVAVDDLVAFGATIGGFRIGEKSIYSGLKDSVHNPFNGIFMDSDGQISLGDAQNYLKYYKDEDEKYHLSIAAESLTFGLNGTTIEEALSETLNNSTEEFYQSDSPTELINGEWSFDEPVWSDGKYLWRRTKNTYGDGRIEYSPSENGVCITGNTGQSGKDGQDSVLLYIDSSNGTVFKNNSVSTVLSVTIYYGNIRITDLETLQKEFGTSAYLQWKLKMPDGDEYINVARDDYRIGGSGFTFTISPDDISIRATFICELIV